MSILILELESENKSANNQKKGSFRKDQNMKNNNTILKNRQTLYKLYIVQQQLLQPK